MPESGPPIRANDWLRQLRAHVATDRPAVTLGAGRLQSLGDHACLAAIRWSIDAENRDIADLDCWLSFDFVDTTGSPLAGGGQWRWHPDPSFAFNYVRMDRQFRHRIAGNALTELSGAVAMPRGTAERMAGIRFRIDRLSFDISRFEPGWEPNLAVRSDRIEKDGLLYAIRARENIFNREYGTIGLTPVVRIFDHSDRELKQVRCKEWPLASRTGATYKTYVRLPRKVAIAYHRHFIDFEAARFLSDPQRDAVAIELRKSGFSASEPNTYISNAELINRGFESLRVRLRFLAYRRNGRAGDCLASETLTVPPRSRLPVARQLDTSTLDLDGFGYIGPVTDGYASDGMPVIPR